MSVESWSLEGEEGGRVCWWLFDLGEGVGVEDLGLDLAAWKSAERAVALNICLVFRFRARGFSGR